MSTKEPEASASKAEPNAISKVDDDNGENTEEIDNQPMLVGLDA
jgi:hypothetical protein